MGLFTPRPRGQLQPFELRRGDLVASLHPRVGPELSSAWLANPDTLTPDAAPGKPWRGRSPDGAWFIKRRHGRKGRRALERSFHTGLELEELGLAIPVHLALIHRRRTTWLITEYLPGQDLDEALPASSAPLDLIERTAHLIAALHQAGYRQRDLKAPNLRVTEQGTLALVDLEGIRRGATPTRRQKDLGRLAASFQAMQSKGAPPAHWTHLIRSYTQHQTHLGTPTDNPTTLESRTRARGQTKRLQHKKQGRPSR